jgi:hypothetical protein
MVWINFKLSKPQIEGPYQILGGDGTILAKASGAGHMPEIYIRINASKAAVIFNGVSQASYRLWVGFGIAN